MIKIVNNGRGKMVINTNSPITWEAEEGELRAFDAVEASYRVPGQPGLHTILSQDTTVTKTGIVMECHLRRSHKALPSHPAGRYF